MKYKYLTFSLLLLFVLGLCPAAKADEGMWLPMHIKRLNHVDMQKHGLKLTADEIYSINSGSLKDAIISFGGFCTGEIISSQSLILTNHHCGYDLIQNHSTVQNNYLADGFWAKTKAEELPNKGLTASFLIRMEDVTSRILPALKDTMSEERRAATIAKINKDIVAEATKGTNYNANVSSFFNGNEFYLFVYETFKDVRLVGAPPSSIGKFGGETDNWMWTRHTGDFSMFRVYSGPDGKPAEYSKDNIPMKPRHFLPVSTSGVKEGDFSMVMGYPGRTDRFLTSFGVKAAIDISNPERVDIRRKKLDVIEEFSAKDPSVKILYADNYAQIANYWKYFIGQTRGLKALHVIDKKEAIEADFDKWVSTSPASKAKYGNALQLISDAYSKVRQYLSFQTAYGEAFMGSGIIANASEFKALESLLAKGIKPTDSEVKEMTTGLSTEMAEQFKEYNFELERKMLGVVLEKFYAYVPANQRPEGLTLLEKKYKGDWIKAGNELADKSILSKKESVDKFLANPTLKDLQKDPVYALFKSVNEYYISNIAPLQKVVAPDLGKGNRLFVGGLLEMNKDKVYAPNANSTMRLTYGNVKSYSPKDGVLYKYQCTLEGIMEKEDPNNPEFTVPARLKELWKKKDFGRWAENGTVPVAFISNTDITGGNSGSPVINGKGQLIGLAFDGNWEAMSGDIAFEPELQRTISVDIRYVLFIIEKYAQAGHLIDEMTLVKNEPEMEVKPATEAIKAPETVAAPAEVKPIAPMPKAKPMPMPKPIKKAATK